MLKPESPETLKAPYFTMKTTLDKTDLAKASEILLKAVKSKPKLTKSYCLEVNFVNDEAHFRVCLNPTLWFDVYLRQKPVEEAVKIARKYVTETRLQVPPENDGPFIVEHDKIEKDIAYTLCKYGKNCKNYQNGDCRRDHSDMICNGAVTNQAGLETRCNYYVFENSMLFSADEYVLLCRREPVRGLLMVPRPNSDEKKNYNHFDNEGWITKTSFWQSLLYAKKKFEFYSVSINFGEWENGKQDFHAHIHLNFDSIAWENLKSNKVKSPWIKRCLNARNYPQSSNLLKNIREFEHERLQALEQEYLTKKILEVNEKLLEVMKENNKATRESDEAIKKH